MFSYCSNPQIAQQHWHALGIEKVQPGETCRQHKHGSGIAIYDNHLIDRDGINRSRCNKCLHQKRWRNRDLVPDEKEPRSDG